MKKKYGDPFGIHPVSLACPRHVPLSLWPLPVLSGGGGMVAHDCGGHERRRWRERERGEEERKKWRPLSTDNPIASLDFCPLWLVPRMRTAWTYRIAILSSKTYLFVTFIQKKLFVGFCVVGKD